MRNCTEKGSDGWQRGPEKNEITQETRHKKIKGGKEEVSSILLFKREKKARDLSRQRGVDELSS